MNTNMKRLVGGCAILVAAVMGVIGLMGKWPASFLVVSVINFTEIALWVIGAYFLITAKGGNK